MLTRSEVRRKIAACLAAFYVACLGVAMALISGGIWPELGDTRYSEGCMTIDASCAGKGYIQVQASSDVRLKLRITHGETVYIYDLNGENEFEVFPLQMGSGEYVCSLYKNVQGTKYAKDAEIVIQAELEDETAPFVVPSQYVNYTPDSPAVAASMEICAGLETNREKISAVRDFMSKGFLYDYMRALTITEAYLGDIDGCFETRTGLCQDLAAVAACMLRAQGVPTQLVIGYVGNNYHAWNNVYVDGEYQRLDITAILCGFPSDSVYTAERYY